MDQPSKDYFYIFDIHSHNRIKPISYRSDQRNK